MTSHAYFMSRCLEAAALGGRAVSPNPMVGAVLVHNDKVISEGYHHSDGGPHAEVLAIQNADPALLERSTLYVSLEPCAHFGRTPPCAELILKCKVPRVVIGCRDPYPTVAGNGVRKLLEGGVDVIEGIMEREAILLNRSFIMSHRNLRPYTILKWAQTCDGFIARSDGSSKWISSEVSRTLVHAWRSQEMSILVGTNTAMLDNPQLTARHNKGVNPLRLVIDRNRRLAKSLAIFDGEAETWIFTSIEEPAMRGVRVFVCDFTKSLVPQILSILHANRVTSLIVEGGTDTLSSFIAAGAWDEARIFVAPNPFGSGLRAPEIAVSPSSVEQSGPDTLNIIFHRDRSRRLGLLKN